MLDPAGHADGAPPGDGQSFGNDDSAGTTLTVAAVFPPCWVPEEPPATEQECWEWEEDPGSDPADPPSPAQIDALLARLPAGPWDDDPEPGDGGNDRPGPGWLAGLVSRDLGGECTGGFDAGGVVDKLPPGLVLAALARGAWQAGLARLSDDELVGVALAWRRLNSWVTAGELAAVAELDRRRTIQADAAADHRIAEHLPDELALAMTLTGRAANGLLEFAQALARLPRTRAALAAGDIDRAKAYVLTDELSGLDGPHAAQVEAEVLGRAAQQTTGQLRAAAKRAVLAVDPAAARTRREKARANARVEVWDEPSGTASLAGRDLPPVQVLAADRRISALARRLKAAGREETLDKLRAAVYTALLLGRPLDDLASPDPEPAHAPAAGDARAGATRAGGHGPGHGQHEPARAASSSKTSSATPAGPVGTAGGDHPQPGPANPAGPAQQGEPGPEQMAALGEDLRGTVNLTMPLSAWLGGTDSPGEVAGSGAVPAADARALATLLTGRPGNRWCLTLTGPGGRAVAHGCARAAPTGSDPHQWALQVTIRPLATGRCGHEREGPGYRPSHALRHALHVRQRTCSFPACRRAATRCDLDHSVPYAQGGRTCECGMAPLCRRHHRAKQAHGWQLEQPQPGTLIWRLPHGRSYHAEPDPYLE